MSYTWRQYPPCEAIMKLRTSSKLLPSLWTQACSSSSLSAPTRSAAPSAVEMSLRAKSHTDLQTAGRSSVDEGSYKPFSMSSTNVNGGSWFRNGGSEEVKGLSRPTRRPVRVVRPVSAVNSNGSFLQMNHLQGELVRKRKVNTVTTR